MASVLATAVEQLAKALPGSDLDALLMAEAAVAARLYDLTASQVVAELGLEDVGCLVHVVDGDDVAARVMRTGQVAMLLASVQSPAGFEIANVPGAKMVWPPQGLPYHAHAVTLRLAVDRLSQVNPKGLTVWVQVPQPRVVELEASQAA